MCVYSADVRKESEGYFRTLSYDTESRSYQCGSASGYSGKSGVDADFFLAALARRQERGCTVTQIQATRCNKRKGNEFPCPLKGE